MGNRDNRADAPPRLASWFETYEKQIEIRRELMGAIQENR